MPWFHVRVNIELVMKKGKVDTLFFGLFLIWDRRQEFVGDTLRSDLGSEFTFSTLRLSSPGRLKCLSILLDNYFLFLNFWPPLFLRCIWLHPFCIVMLSNFYHLTILNSGKFVHFLLSFFHFSDSFPSLLFQSSFWKFCASMTFLWVRSFWFWSRFRIRLFWKNCISL